MSVCSEFISWDVNKKWEFVMKNRLCFQCFGTTHRRENCTAPKCQYCGLWHHSMLHHAKRDDTDNRNTWMNRMTKKDMNVTTARGDEKLKRCYLPIVNSVVRSTKNVLTVKTLLDSGSELNIISSNLCKLLQLQGTPITINLIGVAGKTIKKKTVIVELIIEDRMGYQTPIQCIVLDQTCGKALQIDHNILKDWGARNPLPKNLVIDGGEIELLIGMACPRLHQQISMYGDEEMTIVETRFGPAIVGAVPNKKDEENLDGFGANVAKATLEDYHEENELLKLVEMELAGIEKECGCHGKTDEELLFEKNMEDAWTVDPSGRLRVKSPWKIPPSNLLNNRLQAVRRSILVETRLQKDPDLWNLYEKQMEEMISTTVLRPVNPNFPKRYLPLMTVANLDRETTKLRICLDSKAKFGGLSLNDVLLKGKLKMNDVYETITQIRCGKYVLIGDVQKMFWQIMIDPEDEKYHGVIYKGDTYVFTRVGFGHKSSPPVADRAMLKIAQSGKETHPVAAHTLIKKRYMDDIADASNDENLLIRIKNETSDLLGKFGFQIKEWWSNNEKIGTVKEKMKILGIRFDVEKECLSPTIKLGAMKELTKRHILSVISGIWDPMGLCAGVMLNGKLIFQSITRLGYRWDQKIDNEELKKAWESWKEEADKCQDVVVARSILPSGQFDNLKMKGEIVGFCDGSNVGHAAVLYIRWRNEDETKIEVKFLGAKAKVAAIKGNTTPRNELCGALTLTRFTSSTLEAFKETELSNTHDVTLMTDSTTVLSWIQSCPIKYKPYVKNKILEIQTTLPTESWRHVPGSKNKTADILSKGCKRSEIEEIINGPSILRDPVSKWPKIPNLEEEISTEEETLKHNVNATNEEKEIIKERKDAELEEINLINNVNVIEEREPILDLNSFKSWKKVVRITAYVFKFVNILKKRKQESEEEGNEFGWVSQNEIEEAERYWIRRAQREDLKEERKMDKLVPFVDEFGIKRVTGRIQESEIFDYDRKHPTILDSKSRVAELIVEDVHKKLCHPGHNQVIAECRRKYWIISVRRLAKRIGHKCITCRRWRGKRLSQLMANLPKTRIMYSSAPFENSAVDYFGPFLLKFGRRARIKGYGVVVTCLTTRAVYLDVATSLSTDAFLLVLRRLISTHGQPKHIRSDNGTNFVGAERELKDMIDRWRNNQEDFEKVQNFLAENEIKWNFSVPLAPHHNGVVESMVKSVKTALKKLTHDRVMNEEEYRTFLMETQNLINSRPLWPPNEGESDDPPITCNDLLRPKGLNRHPDHLNQGSPRSRYNYIQRLCDEWWRIWLKNFLPNLQVRNKWWKSRESLEIGDVVLLIDPNISRGKWHMGKILEVFPSLDGRIRSVRVRTSNGIYDRPITKLTLLMSRSEYENECEEAPSSQGENVV